MSNESRGLWSRLKWIILIGWVVAAVRFALEFRQQDDPILFSFIFRWQGAIGVYYAMPILLLIGGIKGVFQGLGYGKLVLAMALLSVLCWFVPNAIVYNVAQFQGWTHGRFAPGPVDPDQADDVEIAGRKGDEPRSAPVARSTRGKVVTGLMVASVTCLAGFVWNLFWMNLLVYLPRRLRRNE